MSTLVNHINPARFNIKLILVNGENRFYKISEGIEVLDLKSPRLLYSISSLFKVIRKEKPDIVFTTLTHLNLLFSMFKGLLPGKTKLIVRESSIISINNKYFKYPWLTDMLISRFYKRIDLLICQSEFMSKDLADNYSTPSGIMKVIHNPIKAVTLDANVQKEVLPVFITVGRLNKEKGYDRILKALALLKFDFEYWIVGSGPLKDELILLSEELRISKKIKFTGLVKDPFIYLNKSTMFLQGSHFEGFPNVILEATSCGLPVVAYNAPGGTQEILIDGFNGYLVEEDNIAEFANKINLVLETDFDSEKIKEHTMKKFALNKIMKEYEEAIIDTHQQS